MDVLELRLDLERQQQELLEKRRKRKLNGRQAQRRLQLEAARQLSVDAQSPIQVQGTSLSSIEDITRRPGFLRQQLATAKLTPLRRWSIQLKLLVAQDHRAQRVAAAAGDDLESALQACETILSRDQQCYDVVYREGARVSDARESLLDEGFDGSPILVDVQELLSFSTRSKGIVYRLTSIKAGGRVLFRCSEYVANLQEELERLLSGGASVDAAITFICNTGTP